MPIGDDLTTVATIGVLGLVGLRLASALRLSAARDGRALIAEVWRGVRWRHVWPVPLVLTVVIAAASAAVQVPGLDWGWWTAIGGQGNPISGTTDETIGTIWEWIVPLVFVSMLLPALPLFAHAEERMFRSGAEGWSRGQRVASCVKFGLVHALVGIPLGVALALSLGGGYFLVVYLHAIRTGHRRRDATLESTRAHVVYNLVILVLVALYAILVALDG